MLCAYKCRIIILKSVEVHAHTLTHTHTITHRLRMRRGYKILMKSFAQVMASWLLGVTLALRSHQRRSLLPKR